MDKKIAGLLGAAAALTTVTGVAQAAPAQSTELAPAMSYQDLLDPIPNAVPLLKADDARLARTPANTETRLAQISVQIGHHHHHHHVRRHHHHHHHHHSYHHHHHHHH
jgi:hypothetical protein